ncbi:MAG: hypothetical protein Hyperionvirus6_3 [Hyperionvirus sp.]|uniref:Uncharacterized protein n=1 Tax=Hyperionvirus sp. TaxID=2487770 RepID=A0A3G5A8C8_9VIRU|nr:MAG: hypothetical protein Hyperionvirus6_3 [Hyperionvirus sp.]
MNPKGIMVLIQKIKNPRESTVMNWLMIQILSSNYLLLQIL